MRNAAVLLVALAALACGSATPTPVGAPLGLNALKFKVIDAAGAPAFCDSDFYPVAREGGELANAIKAYPQIKADGEMYAAIVAHEHLPAGDLTDAQKLILYRAYKKLRALNLTSASGGYAFSYRAFEGGSSYVVVAGSVRVDGAVTIDSQTATSAPPCPICLSATTLISTPSGGVVVTALSVGMFVWTQDATGARLAAPILEVGSTPVPLGHVMVHLRLADGRELWASPGHRTADGRPLAALDLGDRVDGSTVTLWELVPYDGGRTYDLLPAGPSSTYWADGILLSSTLKS